MFRAYVFSHDKNFKYLDSIHKYNSIIINHFKIINTILGFNNDKMTALNE